MIASWKLIVILIMVPLLITVYSSILAIYLAITTDWSALQVHLGEFSSIVLASSVTLRIESRARLKDFDVCLASELVKLRTRASMFSRESPPFPPPFPCCRRE